MKKLHGLFIIIFSILLIVDVWSLWTGGIFDSKIEYLVPIVLVILITLHYLLGRTNAIGRAEKPFLIVAAINLVIIATLITSTFTGLPCGRSLTCGLVVFGVFFASGIATIVSIILGIVSVFKKEVVSYSSPK